MTSMSTFILLFLLLNNVYAQDINGFFSAEVRPKTQVMSINAVVGDDLLDKAYSSILQYKTELDIKSRTDLIFIKSSTDDFSNQHFRFGLAYQGLEIDNMQVIVHFNNR